MCSQLLTACSVQTRSAALGHCQPQQLHTTSSLSVPTYYRLQNCLAQVPFTDENALGQKDDLLKVSRPYKSRMWIIPRLFLFSWHHAHLPVQTISWVSCIRAKLGVTSHENWWQVKGLPSLRPTQDPHGTHTGHEDSCRLWSCLPMHGTALVHACTCTHTLHFKNFSNVKKWTMSN